MPDKNQERHYLFLLKAASQELVTFLRELKETSDFSPWLKTLIFRSFFEVDDKLRFLGEIEREKVDLEGYCFGLLLVLQPPYSLPTFEHTADLGAYSPDYTSKLLVLSPTIPASLEQQWHTLLQLIVASNR